MTESGISLLGIRRWGANPVRVLSLYAPNSEDTKQSQLSLISRTNPIANVDFTSVETKEVVRKATCITAH